MQLDASQNILPKKSGEPVFCRSETHGGQGERGRRRARGRGQGGQHREGKNEDSTMQRTCHVPETTYTFNTKRAARFKKVGTV
jgi:hypothetical protein